MVGAGLQLRQLGQVSAPAWGDGSLSQLSGPEAALAEVWLTQPPRPAVPLQSLPRQWVHSAGPRATWISLSSSLGWAEAINRAGYRAKPMPPMQPEAWLRYLELGWLR